MEQISFQHDELGVCACAWLGEVQGCCGCALLWRWLGQITFGLQRPLGRNGGFAPERGVAWHPCSARPAWRHSRGAHMITGTAAPGASAAGGVYTVKFMLQPSVGESCLYRRFQPGAAGGRGMRRLAGAERRAAAAGRRLGPVGQGAWHAVASPPNCLLAPICSGAGGAAMAAGRAQCSTDGVLSEAAQRRAAVPAGCG